MGNTRGFCGARYNQFICIFHLGITILEFSVNNLIVCAFFSLLKSDVLNTYHTLGPKEVGSKVQLKKIVNDQTDCKFMLKILAQIKL